MSIHIRGISRRMIAAFVAYLLLGYLLITLVGVAPWVVVLLLFGLSFALGFAFEAGKDVATVIARMRGRGERR